MDRPLCFWKAKWCADYSLAEVFPNLFMKCFRKQGGINEFGVGKVNCIVVWNLHLPRRLANTKVEEQVSLMRHLETYGLIENQDLLQWLDVNEVFTVKFVSKRYNSSD